MNRAALSLILLCSAALLRAQNAPTPELALDVNAQTDAVVSSGWPLLIRAAVVSSDGRPVKIGVNGGAWTQALHLSIADAGGAALNWPTQLVAPASSTLSLSGITSADAVWLVAPRYGQHRARSLQPHGHPGHHGQRCRRNLERLSLWQRLHRATPGRPATLSPDEEASKYLAFAAYSQLRGDTAGAQTALDTLISHQPGILAGYTEKADLLSSLGDYEGALNLAEQALAKFNAQGSESRGAAQHYHAPDRRPGP